MLNLYSFVVSLVIVGILLSLLIYMCLVSAAKDTKTAMTYGRLCRRQNRKPSRWDYKYGRYYNYKHGLCPVCLSEVEKELKLN